MAISKTERNLLASGYTIARAGCDKSIAQELAWNLRRQGNYARVLADRVGWTKRKTFRVFSKKR